MKINDLYPVDPLSVIEKFAEDGLSLDLLRKCNSQSFRIINGYGEGWFLFTSDQEIDDTDWVTLNLTDTFELDEGSPVTADFELLVLNKLTLHHPDQTDLYIYALHTAEEKYILYAENVDRNYNMVKRNEITDVDFENYYDPDSTPMTLEAIITDIIYPATLVYNGPALTPIEVNIQGLSVFEALESLCRAHGLYWTMRDGVVNVFGSVTVPEISYDKLVDIRKSITASSDVEVNFIHPGVASGLQRNSRYVVSDFGTLPVAINVFMPFMPALFETNNDYADPPVNATELSAFDNTVAPYIRAALDIEDYYHVNEHINLNNGVFGPFSDTVCFTLTFADYGAGPRTIYSAVKYPFHEVPQPYNFDGATSSSQTIYAKFTLTADMLAGEGATASADVDETNDPSAPTTITVTNTLFAKAYTGARGLAFKVGAEWLVIEVQRPSTFVLATLDTHPSSSAPPNVRFGADPREADAAIKTSPQPVPISQYPFDFRHSTVDPVTMTGLIPNPLKFLGQDGELVLLQWNDVSDEYNVVNVFRRNQQFLWVEYTAIRDAGMDVLMDAIPRIPLSNGTYPTLGVESVRDIFNVALNAQATDDGGLAFYVPTNDTDGEYRLIESTHLATNFMGTVYADFDTTDTTFQVTPDIVAGLDGRDISGTQTVENIYHWSGTTGKKVRVEWNGIFRNWQPLQLDWDCPPAE